LIDIGDPELPAGTDCTGGPSGNACVVRCRNPAAAGPFGSCVAGMSNSFTVLRYAHVSVTVTNGGDAAAAAAGNTTTASAAGSAAASGAAKADSKKRFISSRVIGQRAAAWM
jgi:hypothetical protein